MEHAKLVIHRRAESTSGNKVSVVPHQAEDNQRWHQIKDAEFLRPY
jgi:hypothetical protein